MRNKYNYLLFFICTVLLWSTPSAAQKSDKIIDSLQKLLPTVTVDTTRIRILNVIASEYTSDAPDKATQYANQALGQAIKLNDTVEEMSSYLLLGLAQYYQAHYDQALALYAKSFDLATKTHNKEKLAKTLNNIGLVYDDRADYQKALGYYLKALKLSEEAGGNKWQLASTLNNVGLIYKNLNQYDQALEYYNRSMKIKEEVGNKKGVGNSLHNIAMVYKLKGDYEKSLEYYSKALEVRKANNDITGESLTLNNIGNVYEAEHLYDKAFPYFVEALKLRENMKDNYNLCISLYSLGTNYYNRKLYAQGIENINKALEMSKKMGTKDLIRNGYEALALIYAAQKNYEKAYEYQNLLIQVKDSILNVATSQQLNEMQTKYESDKKQKEIELLNKNGEIQSLQITKNRTEFKLWMSVLGIAILLIFAIAILFYNRSRLKQKTNQLLEHRNTEITQQKKEITDSINYAKRIQESILPPTETWNKLLPDSFIFYRPKDIVSGDFYWIEQKNDIVCFAAVDCTGHGVPGALMSVVGFNLLTQAINEVNLVKPSEILKHLDAGVTKTLRQSEEGKGVKDGMDLSLCSLNKKTLELQYAGAFNSLYYVSNGILKEIKADKFPIGVNIDDKVDEYTNHTIQLQKGDCIYLYSDGYADQFGGSKGKKFKYNKLKELLLDVAQLPVEEQRNVIENAFDTWKGGLEQIDDVVVIGVRV
ncbi:MAG: hypothetical protein JWP12_2149 [Bacteroidetes bacterium]|nr:hypothetical protein [Bacteroidota bacterium]